MDRTVGARQGGGLAGHGLAAGLALGILVLWAAATADTLYTLGTRADRSGALLAVFPPATSEAAVLARVSRAQGVLVGSTWFGNVWHVYGEAPDFAGALREQGASLVLPPLPVALLGNSACFGMPLTAPE